MKTRNAVSREIDAVNGDIWGAAYDAVGAAVGAAVRGAVDVSVYRSVEVHVHNVMLSITDTINDALKQR